MKIYNLLNYENIKQLIILFNNLIHKILYQIFIMLKGFKLIIFLQFLV